LNRDQQGDGSDAADIDLAGVVLADARTRGLVDLGAGPPLAVLVVIRHRY
jgi:hypothetical protein